MLNIENHRIRNLLLVLTSFINAFLFAACSPTKPAGGQNAIRVSTVDSGWASNSVNTTVFRKNSLVSFKNTQYIAFYNGAGTVVIGKRNTDNAKWDLTQTAYKGNVYDAHNVISIMVDGEGFLHMAWDHHNNVLHYVRSLAPGSLELSEQMPMTGKGENKISYPEFYRLPDGDLLFFYRDGGSGNGNLVINKYELKTKQWRRLQTNLLDGEGRRNAYWQACTVEREIHLSWVWRESPDVASNHDLCYARSKDGGLTWEKSTGERYSLPITEATAEKAAVIPQASELINQTSMFADAAGRPFIATYWRDSNTLIPQYHLVFKNGNEWRTQNLGFRTTPFRLSGGGTKRIPIARPQIVAWEVNRKLSAAIIFRDEERGNKVSAAVCRDLGRSQWQIIDLNGDDVGSWEPSYDTERWKQSGSLHLFVQRTEQMDAEGKINLPPQMVKVLEWKPPF